MEDYIKELFSTPLGLSPALSIGGTTFYSSDKLKDAFIRAFYKSSKGKSVAPQVEQLVGKDIIIPCYKSKNLFSFIKHKLSRGSIDKYIMAFYSVEEKKVVVLIDNSSSAFGTSSNNELASTTMHECMHLSSGRALSKFLKVFLPNLRKYYTAFYNDYLSLENVPLKNIDNIIKYMINFERYGAEYANKKLSDYYRLIESNLKDYTKLDSQEFQIRLTNLIVATKLFIVSMNSLMRNARKFSMVFTSLNKAYEEAFGKKNKYTTPIQEMVSFSEVACVLSEMDPQDSTIKRLFKIIS
jgi:hypothetical protein